MTDTRSDQSAAGANPAGGRCAEAPNGVTARSSLGNEKESESPGHAGADEPGSGSVPGAASNGSLESAGASYSAAEIEQFKHRDLLFAAAFAKIVSLMMRSPAHNHLHISDLMWLVVPPLLVEQVAIMEAAQQGAALPSPFAAALWARVSPEVDRRLSEDKDGSVRLTGEEWQSGDIFWIIDAVGQPDIVPAFLEELVATNFPGQHPKMRVIDKQGVARTVFVGSPA
jgi:hemolysin-activating ACP:hemolysin acyltransferase